MLNNPRHEKFCLEYAACGNATEAYLKAGYGGQKRKTKNVAAFNLLKKPKIAERIRELTARFVHTIDNLDGNASCLEVACRQSFHIPNFKSQFRSARRCRQRLRNVLELQETLSNLQRLPCVEEVNDKRAVNLNIHGRRVDMLNRCRLSSNKNYRNYGERGIRVCDEWQGGKDGFFKFFEYVSNLPHFGEADYTNSVTEARNYFVPRLNRFRSA